MKEVWRDIPGHEGSYQVSSLGRVKSLSRIVRYSNGAVRPLRGRILKLAHHPNGYRQINIFDRTFFVHKLVLIAFVGPCPIGLECRHLNGMAYDNRIANLCWDTHQANLRDRAIHGRMKRGEACWNAKLTKGQVLEIRRRMAAGEKSQDLAKEFCVQARNIRRIHNRKRWAHLP